MSALRATFWGIPVHFKAGLASRSKIDTTLTPTLTLRYFLVRLGLHFFFCSTPTKSEISTLTPTLLISYLNLIHIFVVKFRLSKFCKQEKVVGYETLRLNQTEKIIVKRKQ